MNLIRIKEKMKIVKYVLLGLVILLISMSLISSFFCICEILHLPVAFNKTGMIYLLAQFSDFKHLYASTIAMISVFYWTFQMDNMEKTNKRIEAETVNKTIQNTVELSKDYYTSLQPVILKFYDLIKEYDNELILYNKWDYNEFNDDSIREKNVYWKLSYHKIKDKTRNQESAVINELESFAANILYGNIDKEMMFKLVGEVFCLQVKVMYPFIATYRTREKTTNYFENTVELFKNWNPKTNNERIN